jgi:hypothetical protein
MSFVVIFRDYFDQIIPLVYKTNEMSGNQHFRSWSIYLQSFCALFETVLPSKILYFLSFQWATEFVQVQVLRPEIGRTRTNSRISSAVPIFPGDGFLGNLDLLVFNNTTFPRIAFQGGFLNAFFLTVPGSIIFLVRIRRYWLQGFSAGFRSTLGHRRGETALLIALANGFAPISYYVGSPLLFRTSCLFTAFILWESFSHHRELKAKPLSFEEQEGIDFLKYGTQTLKNKKRSFFSRSKNLLFIFVWHWFYALIGQRKLFGTFRNQALGPQSFIGQLSYFLREPKHLSNYAIGLFLGGLFFDLCYIIVVLKVTERLLLNLQYAPLDWNQAIHKWTRRFIISISFRTLPFYSSDYLAFSSFGFFGRDTELRRRVTRNTFSCSTKPGIPISILFEGRNVLSEDDCNRAAPDILREPWSIGLLAVETRRDFVDETHRTQQTNQRVDSVYLGFLERKIFEWLAMRRDKGPESQDKTNSSDNNKKQKSRNKKNGKESHNTGKRTYSNRSWR